MLHGMGIRTGVDLPALIAAGRECCALLRRPDLSAVARAMGGADGA